MPNANKNHKHASESLYPFQVPNPHSPSTSINHIPQKVVINNRALSSRTIVYAPQISILSVKSNQIKEGLFVILVAIALLPHLNLANFHLASSWFGPSWIPDVALRPEVSPGSGRAVEPWLTTLSILEPTIGSSNSDVDDEVELLIKRRLITAGLTPYVLQTGSVAVGKRKSSALPERFVEIGVQDLEKTSVDIGEEVLLGPFEAECVFFLGVCSVKSASLHVGAPPSIVCWVGTPVKSGRDDVVSSLCIGVVVSARLSDINLSRQWPRSVGGIHW